MFIFYLSKDRPLSTVSTIRWLASLSIVKSLKSLVFWSRLGTSWFSRSDRNLIIFVIELKILIKVVPMEEMHEMVILYMALKLTIGLMEPSFNLLLFPF